MVTAIRMRISKCRTCGDVWLTMPALGYSGCLSCGTKNRDTLSPAQAKSRGIDVAAVMAQHTDELRRNRLARTVAFVGAMVRATIDDWASRLERWAREGARG